MEKLLKVPYNVFNEDWDLLQQFLERRGNPRYEIVGHVTFFNRQDIFNLGNLVRVDGELDLRYTPIESLGNLEYVGEDLHLDKTPIKSLGNLKYVGGNLSLRYTQIQSLGNLEYVGNTIRLRKNHNLPQEELNKLNKFNHTIF